MRSEEQYLTWKQQRREIRVDPTFADHVMQRIEASKGRVGRSGGQIPRIAGWIGKRPWAQAAVIVLTTAAALVQGVLLVRIGIG